MINNDLNNIEEFVELFGEVPEPVKFDEEIYLSDLSLLISSV